MSFSSQIEAVLYSKKRRLDKNKARSYNKGPEGDSVVRR